jgi:hypothetical protein
MAKFMDVHSGFVGVTAQQLKEAHERDLAIEADEGVHFERAWLDPEKGRSSAWPSDRVTRLSCVFTSARTMPRARSMSFRSRWREMNDSFGSIVHEDRMVEFGRDADQSRRAAQAQPGGDRHDHSGGARGDAIHGRACCGASIAVQTSTERAPKRASSNSRTRISAALFALQGHVQPSESVSRSKRLVTSWQRRRPD